MAVTSFTDMIIPQVLAANTVEESRVKSAFWQAGIISTSEDLQALATRGGTEATVPFWKQFDRDEAEVLAEGTALGLTGVDMGTQVAHVLARGKGFGATDLSKAFNNGRGDPMAFINSEVASYWTAEYQRALMSVLDGCFDTALASTHEFIAGDVDNSDGDTLTPLIANSGKALLSDYISAFDNGAIVVHGDVFHQLNALQYIDKVPLLDSTDAQVITEIERYSDADLSKSMVNMFAGMRVIVDNSQGLTKAAASTGGGFVYKSYMMRQGSVAFGNAAAPVPVETYRNAAIGQDELYTRFHYLIHPQGMTFNKAAGTGMAGPSPTNAELADGAKWSKAFDDDRNIQIVRLQTNG